MRDSICCSLYSVFINVITTHGGIHACSAFGRMSSPPWLVSRNRSACRTIAGGSILLDIALLDLELPGFNESFGCRPKLGLNTGWTLSELLLGERGDSSSINAGLWLLRTTDNTLHQICRPLFAIRFPLQGPNFINSSRSSHKSHPITNRATEPNACIPTILKTANRLTSFRYLKQYKLSKRYQLGQRRAALHKLQGRLSVRSHSTSRDQIRCMPYEPWYYCHIQRKSATNLCLKR
jgi:hypothetical protein